MKEKPEERKMLKTFMRHPEFGRLTDCRENGFGFVDGHFVHVSSGHWDCQPMPELEGTWIAYVRGGDPRSYAQGRREWRESIVSWMSIHLIDGFQEDADVGRYRELHQKRYDRMSGSFTRRLLRAPWYKNLWRKNAKCAPLAPLLPPEKLREALRSSLFRQPSLERIARILCDVSVSYWFASDGQVVNPLAALDLSGTQFSKETLQANPATEHITGPEDACWVTRLEDILRSFQAEHLLG